VQFHSFVFATFLLVLVAAYWALAARRNARYALLLVGSCVFYGAFQAWYLLLILFSTALDYNCGQVLTGARNQARRKRALWGSAGGVVGVTILAGVLEWRPIAFALIGGALLIALTSLIDVLWGARHSEDSQQYVEQPPALRKLALIISLAGNLGLLGFFKYYDWFVGNIALLFEQFGARPPLEVLELVVPVGISFYTFQTLSYTIDVYRGGLKPAKNVLEFAVFVAFFPQLVAGPIVRAKEFLPQLDLTPRFDRERLHDGLHRIGLGLAKKTLIADVIGLHLVDPVFSTPDQYGFWIHLFALYGFGFQIYYDFSAYSDIAIGSAKLFGFDLPENFFTPYRSRSIREFWRRWHVTLSSWVRDYLYFPLGGSKARELRVAFNLLATMIVIGLWHGASSIWVCYGVCNGSLMIMERWLERRRGGGEWTTTRTRSFFAWLYCFHAITILQLCVRGKSWPQIMGVVADYGPSNDISHWAWLALGFGALVHFMPQAPVEAAHRGFKRLPTAVIGIVLGALVGVIWFMTSDTPPFIYFQF